MVTKECLLQQLGLKSINTETENDRYAMPNNRSIMTVKIGDESSQKLTVQPFTLEENEDGDGFSIAAAGAVETAALEEKRKKKVRLNLGID